MQLQHEVIKDNVNHEGNMNFQKAQDPGTTADFEKGMKDFYPDTTSQFKGLNN